MRQGRPEGVCAYRFDGSQLNLGTRRQEPRSWAEKAYHNLTYFNEVDKGGHFAAWEEPELFTTEVQAAFRSLR